MNKGQLLLTTGIDLCFFLIIVYYAGGLVSRVEALERQAVPEAKVAVLESKLESQNKQLDRLESKLDRALESMMKNQEIHKAGK